MSILVWILIAIGVVVGMVALLLIMMYSVADAIGSYNENAKSAWAYWNEKKLNKWEDLSDEEKEKILSAYMVIEADCGGCCSVDEIREFLKQQLPILEPNVGLSIPAKVSECC